MQQKNQYYYLLISLMFFSSCLYIQNILAVNTNPADQFVVNTYTDQTEFDITLKSNPTTGYQWYLIDINDDLISSVDKRFTHNVKPAMKQKPLIGAGGSEIWHFKVKPSAFKVPRMTTITLQYLRPWQMDEKSTPENTVTYKIIINPIKKH